MNLEVLICCYGDYPDITLPTLQKIISLADHPENLRIHVGTNACGKKTTDFLRQAYDAGDITTLVECKENRNKDPTMRVLIEHVEEPYFVWFDDDTYPTKKGWNTKVLSIIEENKFDVAGFVHTTNRNIYPGYKEFLSKRPWFTGWDTTAKAADANLHENAVFAHGAFWIARTAYLREHDYPDRDMIKKADDMLLGEMIVHTDGKLLSVGELWDKWIRVNKGPRRGTGERADDGWKGMAPRKIIPKTDGLTIYPTGGMCNRLRNILSAIILCREEKVPLRVVLEEGSSQIASVDFRDYWTFPSDVVVESMPTGEIMEMHEREASNRYLRIPKDKLHGAYHNHWGLTCLEGEEITDRRLVQGMKENVLPLKPEWQAKVDSAANLKNLSNCSGVHIRAFEFLFGERKESQIVELMNNFRNKLCGDAAPIFLCTDSGAIQTYFRMREHPCRYWKEIKEEVAFLSRQTKEDFEHGLMDFYLLGKCKKVYGTKGSSMSHMAGIMAGELIWVDGCREAKEWEG